MSLTPFLAIDPGRNAGWAVFGADGTLEACGLATEPYKLPHRLGGWPVLVIEEPHEGETGARKRDVIRLAVRMGQLITLAKAVCVVRVQPVQWKGGVPKKIMVPRIRDRWMTPADRAVLESCGSVRHDVVDAIGLGIWWCRVNGARGQEGELGPRSSEPSANRAHPTRPRRSPHDPQETRSRNIVRPRVAGPTRDRGRSGQGPGYGSR